jgi:hypothetical protein
MSAIIMILAAAISTDVKSQLVPRAHLILLHPADAAAAGFVISVSGGAACTTEVCSRKQETAFCSLA